MSDIKFKVVFEDKTAKMLSAAEIDKLNDKRRFIVVNSKGQTIMKKTFKG